MENKIALYTCFDDFNDLENRKFFSTTLNVIMSFVINNL